ncbi:MAG: chorismate synthase [Oscillospiraceae bacterium]|nr:chorismate synthase [Oscillospiraceae bacterium]
MSSTFGTALRLTVFGQSHAPAIGMCMDGFPAGFAPDFDALNAFLARRAPGKTPYATARAEADLPEFLSGFSGGKTCGAPIAAIIRNTDVHEKDYVNLNEIPRPSHADWTAYEKYGADADRSGGGHFSGRLTAPLCIAGGLCLQWLKEQGIRVGAHIQSIGAVRDASFDPVDPTFPAPAPLTVLDAAAAERMAQEIQAAKADGDSIGGSIECAVTGLPAGLGEPMFDGMENRLAQLLFGIPAVKGVEFGSGFACATMRGSEHNDAFCYDENGNVRTRTNHAGGILGGITTAMPLIFRVAVKPTPSIAKEQESIRFSGGSAQLQIHGRHDPCIVPRAVPCVEAAAAIAVLDALLEAKKWK